MAVSFPAAQDRRTARETLAVDEDDASARGDHFAGKSDQPLDERRASLARSTAVRLGGALETTMSPRSVAEPIREAIGDHSVAEAALTERDGLGAVSVGSIEGDGMRYGLATSASNARTKAIAKAIVTNQSTIVRHGWGIRPGLGREPSWLCQHCASVQRSRSDCQVVLRRAASPRDPRARRSIKSPGSPRCERACGRGGWLSAFRLRAARARRRWRGADLRDLLAVDVDREHPVQDEVELAAAAAPRSTSVSSGSSRRRSGIRLPAMSSRETSARARLSRRHEGSGLLVAQGVCSPCASRYQVLKSIVPDFATGCRRGRRPSVVGGFARRVALRRAVGVDRERERRPGSRGLDTDERLAYHAARRRKPARPPTVCTNRTASPSTSGSSRRTSNATPGIDVPDLRD